MVQKNRQQTVHSVQSRLRALTGSAVTGAGAGAVAVERTDWLAVIPPSTVYSPPLQ